ncbi:MAG: hypothetical protein ACI9DH_000992 [Halioglobus sp.]|jgi:hypothetical protein
MIYIFVSLRAKSDTQHEDYKWRELPYLWPKPDQSVWRLKTLIVRDLKEHRIDVIFDRSSINWDCCSWCTSVEISSMGS